MALEDIKQDLEKKFSEPLKEFYKRRIIFWNDEEGEFKDEVTDLILDNTEVLILTENNQFLTKKLLSNDDLTHNYLVYNPFDTDPEKDWLLDIKLYSESYRADKTSRIMHDLNILNLSELRTVVKELTGFFNSSKRCEIFRSYSSNQITSKNEIYMTVLASICNTKDRTPFGIIKSLIFEGNDASNSIKLDALKYCISNQLWTMISRYTGYQGNNVDELTRFVVLSAMTKTMNNKVFDGLEGKYSDIHTSCYDFVNSWIHSNDKDSFRAIAEKVSDELNLEDRFNHFEVSDLIGTDVLPCIDEVILMKLMASVENNTIKYDELHLIIEKRKGTVWFDDFSHFYNGMECISKALEFHENHRNSFHHTVAKEMWNTYVNDYYKMDTIYREFHVEFNNSLNNINIVLDDDFKKISEWLEREYKNWFLDKLSENWTKIIEEDLANTGEIKDIKQETRFYDQEVKNNDPKGKVFVVISDALRYEVGCSLANKLRIETRGQVALDSRQAIFPSITPFGMAALLPHKELKAVNRNGKIEVLIDGQSTVMSNRESILKSYENDSVVLRYSDFINMKREEKRKTTNGMKYIYIYHDTIDNAGHDDNSSVFDACDKAINELVNLVKVITDGMMGTSIVITADHGFLYTNDKLDESDKMDRSSFKNDVIEQGRRYVLTNNLADPKFLLKVNGIYSHSNISGFTPRENIRLKGAGSMKFVHGGVSLQELAIPVIKYKYMRLTNVNYRKNRDKVDATPVKLSLLSSSRKISNMIFNLHFYQEQAVKDNYIPCSYEIYMTDKEGNKVSDIQKIVADRTNTSNQEREYQCTFNLKSQQFDPTKDYYLVIVDEEHNQIPNKTEMQIDIAMAIDEFDFFG